jgi:hypothetical protein
MTSRLNSAVTFWGIEKRRGFNKTMLYYTIFKDLEGIGYDALKKKLPDWLNLSNDQHKGSENRLEIMVKDST